MAQIPRKPSFPSHIVKKVLTKISQEVQDNVIPVSTGIYTQQKLVSQLQKIQKPIIVDYDDRIFYEVVQKQGTCHISSCPSCKQEFSTRKKPIMCHFCTNWSCQQCSCHRTRLNPLDNNPNGKRYNICYECDGKYLNLQLNHPYVQNRMLIQTAIVQVSKQLEELEQKLEEKNKKIDTIKNEPKRKLAMKQSILKKQQLDTKKTIKKISWQIQAQKDKSSKLQQKLQSETTKLTLLKQKKQRSKLLQQKQKQEELASVAQQQRLKKIEQQKRLEQEKQKQRVRVEKQEALLRDREKEKERLQILEIELQKEKEKEKRRQKEREIELQKDRQREIQRQREREREKEREKQREREREKQRQKQQERKRQIEKQKQAERQREIQKQIQVQKQKQQQRKRQQIERQKQLERQKQVERIQQLEQKQKQRQAQLEKAKHLQQKAQIQFTFDPNSTKSDPTLSSESTNRNSYLYNQFKNYFTEDSILAKNSQALNEHDQDHEGDPHPLHETSHDMGRPRAISQQEKQMLFTKFRRSLDEEEAKAADSQDLSLAKMEIMKEANKKRRDWENMNQEEDEGNVGVSAGQKCKCAIF